MAPIETRARATARGPGGMELSGREADGDQDQETITNTMCPLGPTTVNAGT